MSKNDIGDIIRGSLGNPLDAIIKAALPGPAIADQVRPPTTDEMRGIEEVAEKAAQLQDELSELSPKFGELKRLKTELKAQMMKHDLREVVIAGRPPIELNESNSRKPTRAAIVAVMQEAEVKKLTEEQRRDPKLKKKAEADGKMRALNLWNAMPQSTSYSVSIPAPAPTEMESPY